MKLDKIVYVAGTLALLRLAYRVSSFTWLYLRPSSLPRYLRTRNGQKAWALVTGASDGIGRGFAQELCERGFNVVIHGRDTEETEGVRKLLNAEYPQAEVRVVVGDVSTVDESLIEQFVSAVQDVPLTVLINNVGGVYYVLDKDFKSFEEHTTEEVEAVVNLNSIFPTLLTKALLPILQRNGPSLVMTMGSQAADGMPYLSVYAGAKAYLRGLNSTLILESKATDSPLASVEFLHITVGAVRTKGLPGKPDYFRPLPRAMARGALERVGCGYASVHGYFSHALQQVALDTLPTSRTDKQLVRQMQPLAGKSVKKR